MFYLQKCVFHPQDVIRLEASVWLSELQWELLHLINVCEQLVLYHAVLCSK